VISHYTNVTPHLKTIGETNGMRATWSCKAFGITMCLIKEVDIHHIDC
jgi:hypothetical protein